MQITGLNFQLTALRKLDIAHYACVFLALHLKIHLSQLDEGYYLSTNRSDDGVYLVDTYYGEGILRSLESYRNLQLIDFLYESDYDDLKSFEISGKHRISLEFKNTADVFVMTQPIEYDILPKKQEYPAKS